LAFSSQYIHKFYSLRSNEEAKLDADGKWERRARRDDRDKEKGGNIASVYAVRDMGAIAHRAILVTNARQLMATGCAVITPHLGLLIVEGGPRTNRRFRKLVLERIDWTTAGKGEEEREIENNQCLEVWTGEVVEPNFKIFSVTAYTDEAEALAFLDRHACGKFWDLAKTHLERAEQDPTFGKN
jgi:U4/U6 small nuclear ribonucleoprotein PRP3